MIRRAIVIALVALGLAGCAAGGSPSPNEAASASAGPTGGGGGTDPAAIGRAFVEALARGDTAAAEAMEDDKMRAAAPAAMLAQLWSQLEAQLGAFRELGEITTTEQAPYVTAAVEARFENATVPLLVTVTADGRVAGLHLGEVVPAASPGASGAASPSPSPAVYVDPDAFNETEVTVGSAPWELPGTLAMPVGDGPFPAVVLLAGSGPNDRDETIGPNKPLRDLAWGLASNGIAVLRYDKRTKAHAQAMAAAADQVTVREEVVDDALAAVDLLRGTPGVDPDLVFLAGHSLGAYLAPRIAAEAPGALAGIALLEANSSPLGEVILDQVEYLMSVQPSPDPQASDHLATLRAQVARAESPNLSPTTPRSELPLGIPAAYWLDLRAYDPLATARDLAIPMLFVQGGRDYQVPPSELAAWRTALAGRADVTFREYPTLNHLLMDGSGPSTPAEYATPGHVVPEIVADLAAWIRAER